MQSTRKDRAGQTRRSAGFSSGWTRRAPSTVYELRTTIRRRRALISLAGFVLQSLAVAGPALFPDHESEEAVDQVGAVVRGLVGVSGSW